MFDICASILGLVLLSPLFLIVSGIIYFTSPGGVFFRQERVGLNNEIFKIYKFRTMYVNTESQGRLTIGHDSRVTPIGHFIRKYKIDELPQLIDVVIGTMSLVGPRPEVQEFIEHYPDDIRKKVLSVRPGITDLASIEMVDENHILSQYSDPKQAYIDLILPTKQKYYLDYVAKKNFFLDIKIIFLTLRKIIR